MSSSLTGASIVCQYLITEYAKKQKIPDNQNVRLADLKAIIRGIGGMVDTRVLETRGLVPWEFKSPIPYQGLAFFARYK